MFVSPLTQIAAKVNGSLNTSGLLRSEKCDNAAGAFEADHARAHAAHRKGDAVQAFAAVEAAVFAFAARARGGFAAGSGLIRGGGAGRLQGSQGADCGGREFQKVTTFD